MLRFAGYMIGTAGGATGVWAATGAATNAVVGFATDVLEKAMNDTVIGPSGPGTPAKQEQIRKRREKFGIQEVGSGRSNFERSDSLERGYLATERLRGRADRTKRFYQTLANCHRHQQQVGF